MSKKYEQEQQNAGKVSCINKKQLEDHYATNEVDLQQVMTGYKKSTLENQTS